ncbi:MAG TPA: D-arabinono-1,4-lactone oxidase [Streptosporangiaceae bacterium]|jgi:FAD-linked oxidoreductase
MADVSTAIWRNWAGNQRARPRRVAAPRSTEDVAAAVRAAADAGMSVRMRGTGHSFTGAAVTDGMLLEPGGMTGVRTVDAAAGRVTVDAGMPLHTLNDLLARGGLALTNMGDIAVQTVAGAIQTGTHGTGRDSGAISAQVQALELVLADGSVRTVARDSASADDRDLFHAARVGLGALGVVTAVTFDVEKAFLLRAREQPMPLDEVLDGFDDLVKDNEHFEFYWFPHTGSTSTKRNNRVDGPPAPLGRLRAWLDDEFVANDVFEVTNRVTARLPRTVPLVNAVATRALGSRTYTDASHRVFAHPRRVRFVEQEYAIPRGELVAAMREIRALIDRRGWRVSFPIEVRVTPPDDAWLATSYGRDPVGGADNPTTAYIACHMYHRTPNPAYFAAVEDVLTAVGGRPHWGKLHTRDAAYLASAYPRFADFTALRARLDPEGRFANPYLAQVLGG